MKNLSSVVFVLSTLTLSACDPQDKPTTDEAPVAAPVVVVPSTPAVAAPVDADTPAPTVVEVTAEPVAAPAK